MRSDGVFQRPGLLNPDHQSLRFALRTLVADFAACPRLLRRSLASESNLVHRTA